ncbi:hypothetical protein EV126DRAFT_419017 [Verticillium dahliae]|nr:hypothetical protein EV126DRAFT_419017 [Verticillium dahliae]
MARLIAWIKKHLGKGPVSNKQSAGNPPFLPTPRRPLTPAGFESPNTNGVGIQRQPSQCLFFTKVPDDCRHMILTTAFGGRVLHMDLIFDISPSPKLMKAGQTSISRQKVWQYRGAVCNRPNWILPETGPVLRFSWTGLWNDGCMTRIYEGKQLPFDAEKIDIMGFLLSCRQAYTEGIHILYSSNVICIRSKPLLLHLPKLMPSERLASIVSLEITVEPEWTLGEDGILRHDFNKIKPILDNIAQQCHQLRSLCISIFVGCQGDMIIGGPALPMMDDFYRAMHAQLRDMRVEVPYPTYRACTVTPCSNSHPLEAPDNQRTWKSKWRALDGEEAINQFRSLENFPKPPLRLPITHDGDERSLSAGYWLTDGAMAYQIMAGGYL